MSHQWEQVEYKHYVGPAEWVTFKCNKCNCTLYGQASRRPHPNDTVLVAEIDDEREVTCDEVILYQVMNL